MGLLDGKVAVITGAGRGIGRTEALLLASEGASVVVNDVGAAVSGEASEERPAEEPVNASIINTSSEAGLFGNAGQLNYGAAKAGIAAMTIILARELERFGVRSNAIAPRARTRMTEFLMGSVGAAADEKAGFDTWAPENTAALVAWLASDLSKGVSGQVFIITGGLVQLAQGWHSVNKATSDKPWTIDSIEAVRDQLFKGIDAGVPAFTL